MSAAAQVFLDALITALATGLGALPFAFVRTVSVRFVATANAVAAGLMLGASFGAWSATATTTEEFVAALGEAKERVGLRLIHMKIDVEQLAASGATISGLRARKA